MTHETCEHCGGRPERKDDSFIRKLVLVLIGAILIMVADAIWLRSENTKQIALNTERLEKMESVFTSVIEMKTEMKHVSNTMSDMAKQTTVLMERQNQNQPVINDLRSHLRDVRSDGRRE